MGEYETVDSLPEMLLVLNSKQHDVKKVVLEYLIKVQDRRAVPTLIDALDDSSDDLRIDALVALQNTVGQGPTNWHMGQDKDVVAYWKNWAVQHQEELIRLHSQLESSQKTENKSR